jgi:ABC-2 type transport system permease protein
MADRPGAAVFRHTIKAARSSVIWGYVFGAFVASSAWSYSSIYKTAAQREKLAAAFGANTATIAQFGPAPQLQTVNGFTVFKVSITLMIVGSVWGLLTSTRLLRGEEDAGRWDFMLAGQTTRRRAAAQGLAAFGVSAFALWTVTALIISIAGISSRIDISPGPALFLALALTSPALMFLAVGALTSQLAPTRRQAAGYAAVVLVASYGLRMIGDAGIGLHFLTWMSPLGWVEQMAPLTANHPAPLLLVAAFTAVVAGAAVHLAGTRDVGSSVIPDRAESRPRLGLLGNQLGLSLRLMRATGLSWIATLVVFGLLFGLVAQGAGATLSGSSLKQVFGRLGATGGGVGAYLGVAFLMVAVLISFAAAGQISAARTEEAEGRLDHLLARPTPRTRWLGGRLVLTVALVACAGLAAGVFMWAGSATQDSGVAVTTLIEAGLNAVTPAIFLLGLGAFLLGVRPGWAGIGVYAVLAWSLLVELVGGIGAVSRWVLDTSVFHHVASAPAVAPDWAADALVAGIGVAAALVGAFTFRRRDIVSA